MPRKGQPCHYDHRLKAQDGGVGSFHLIGETCRISGICGKAA